MCITVVQQIVQRVYWKILLISLTEAVMQFATPAIFFSQRTEYNARLTAFWWSVLETAIPASLVDTTGI